MPFFDYKCTVCGKTFEELVKNGEEKVFCPACGKEAEKIYSGRIFGPIGQKKKNCSGNCSSCGGCG